MAAFKKMTETQRRKVAAKAQRLVDEQGLMKTAERVGVTYPTLRRFLGGQPMHEATLRQIESVLA